MPALTKEQILSADDRPKKTVPVPGWGGEVIIRKLSAKQKAEIESYWQFDDNGKFIQSSGKLDRARAVCLACINDAGEPIFAIGDAEALSEKSFEEVGTISDEIYKLSGLKKKDTVKNLPETTGD